MSGPDARVSRPMMTRPRPGPLRTGPVFRWRNALGIGALKLPGSFPSATPAARATWTTLSGARNPLPARSRMPSVPKISPMGKARIEDQGGRIKGKNGILFGIDLDLHLAVLGFLGRHQDDLDLPLILRVEDVASHLAD